MTLPGRGGPQPHHDQYDLAGAPTPPQGLPAVNGPVGTHGQPVRSGAVHRLTEQYPAPVPTGWEPAPDARRPLRRTRPARRRRPRSTRAPVPPGSRWSSRPSS